MEEKTCPHCNVVYTDTRRVNCGSAECRRKHNCLRVARQRRDNPEMVNSIQRKYMSSPKGRKYREEKVRRYKQHSREVLNAQQKRRYAKTQDAVHKGKRWTKEEVQRIFDPSMKDIELCEELGRSLQAIELARIRFKEFAPTDWQPKGTKKIVIEQQEESNEQAAN